MATDTQLIVIGSGAAGLSAALSAAQAGARVRVLEASDRLGGTTAFSGALLWAPGNRWARAAGHDDSLDSARRYVQAVLGERAADPRWAVFFERINPLLAFLERETPLRFGLCRYPDAFGEWADGTDFRHVHSDPIPLSCAGPLAASIRRPPDMRDRIMVRDLEGVRPFGLIRPRALLRILPRLAWRGLRGRVHGGVALVVALLGACQRYGVEFQLNARVSELRRVDGRVAEVVYRHGDHEHVLRAERGVLVASGGFDWNPQLMRRFLPVTIEETQTPPVNRGDAIAWAEALGARLAHMDEAWWLPGKYLPGTPLHDGQAVANWLVGDRIWPHSLWVNRHGRRFCNESAQNTGNHWGELDEHGEPRNLPCFAVFDAQFRRRYPLLARIKPGQADPDWLVSAPSLALLAERIGVPAAALEASVARFNRQARAGRDEDFGRGEGLYERYFGDPRQAHPVLGSVERPPFYAYRLATSSVGTKGGLATDADARVLDQAGQPIPGLYAAGNAAAAFNGPLTVAAGCTIPPALVMGHVAALHALVPG
ncbi:hypothetical protein DNJ95_18450 [Stutzerimonas kirkiae]|uniref:FAD-dependent oxidoreductase 2 FAD-binding domain-containing protein n=1 Tax=Stutzerimonas kirkiae TaxID=2211392 RepID=A0A4Q9QY46_9GAMM|nr:FAD-dependent oxidoreductase [Stutzerimonas kirkiae]TBU90050.1 hypothetical protein DNJ96_16970 [Stutzerimonas kirkiae]TBU98207.1 hypothetical protein DNJ95_18450 [Stutzerimonas kirkiae]TBV10175.1 hypothetical protein DNK01_18125 [Stutzerimonas kirkiae]